MGAIGMFRRPTWIRRWGPDGRRDIKTRLNVQPLGSDNVKAQPEGARRDNKLKAFGSMELTPADQLKQQRGDWMYYRGQWYVCVSCILRDHTIVGNFRSEWERVSESERPANLVPPIEPEPEAPGESTEGEPPGWDAPVEPLEGDTSEDPPKGVVPEGPTEGVVPEGDGDVPEGSTEGDKDDA